MSGVALAREHLLYGRFSAAEAAARSLLASDAASEAAALLLELRIDQGWFGDAIALARERFRTALPETSSDCAAATRLQIASVRSGADAEEAIRVLHSVEETARSIGDVRVQAFACESIAGVEQFTETLRQPGPALASAVERFRIAMARYDASGDAIAAARLRLRLGNVLLFDDRAQALALYRSVASDPRCAPLHIAARVAIAGIASEGEGDDDLASLIASCDEAGAAVFCGRALGMKVQRALERHVFDRESAAAAMDAFRFEGAALDLLGVSGAIVSRLFDFGILDTAIAVAEEAIATATAMPYPYGE